MKYSQSPIDSSEDVQHDDDDLQSALDAMLAVVRCVNDSMHQVAITGYQVKSFLSRIELSYPFDPLKVRVMEQYFIVFCSSNQ